MSRTTKSLVVAVSAVVINALAFATDPPTPSPTPLPSWVPPPPPPATVTAATPQAAVAPAAGLAGPKIQFDATVYDFGKAMAGELVKHQFYFTNTGSQDLLLSNVQPQCGCTTTGEWTRLVKPGQFGVIPIQFNTANYNSPVTKQITVTSNDKVQTFLALQLKGTVWKPIVVNPQVVVLNLRSEAPFNSGVVHITNSLEQPLWLSLPECNNPIFGAELRTNIPGREYLVVVSNNTALPPGGLQAQISLKTSVTNLPVISIVAYANMQAALTVSPAQIMLPASPLPTNQLIRYITLINNTTNPLTLSDMAVNAKNVQVTTQTLQAGKYYTITLAFPPDFEVVPGEPVVFSAHTSNPQFEVVKVPINQMPRSRQAANPNIPPPGTVSLKRPELPAPRPVAAPVAPTVALQPPVAPTIAPKPAPAQVSLRDPDAPPIPPSN